jgi:cell division protein FtsL
MASLASFVNRFVGINELAEVRPAIWTRADTCRLRPIANEDVFLFVKRIDNSAVVRAADPLARRARSRSVATGFVAAMLVIAGLLPSAYNTMAGFTVQNLEQEQNKLKQERAALDLDEAKMLNPARLEQLAKSLKMIEPIAQQVQYLDSKAKDDARNRLPLTGPEATAHEPDATGP